MAGSRFGRRYDREKLIAPSLIDADVLEVLCHAVGAAGAPAQALRELLARRARGDDVVCLADERDLFVVARSDLPTNLIDTDEN